MHSQPKSLVLMSEAWLPWGCWLERAGSLGLGVAPILR